MNNITKLLNIEDEGIRILNISIENNTKVIEIEKIVVPHFCPNCHERMYSKGIYKRTVNHSMLQDGFTLSIQIHQRRWVCSNPECRFTVNDEFTFVQPGKRITNLLPFLIVNALNDINKTTVMVAKQFNVSDTYVHYCFAKMVDMKRLPLPRILCVDEVHLNISDTMNYCFVMMDFETREIVDILPNRRQKTLDEYFYGISKKERNNVEIIISDMYQSYLDFPSKYFTHSHVIVDSFHVIAYINQQLNLYLIELERKFKARDKQALEEKNFSLNTEYKTSKKSKEVILLQKYKFFLLADADEITYYSTTRYNRHLKQSLTTDQIEKMFFEVDDKLKIYRDYKQKYLRFNKTKFESKAVCEERLHEIINDYFELKSPIFTKIANLLKVNIEHIVNSFEWVQLHNEELKSKNEVIARLSNGPMESFNRIPKDYKRNGRGHKNFEFVRNRLIFSNRKNAPILAIPKSDAEVHSFKGKVRGSYKSNKK